MYGSQEIKRLSFCLSMPPSVLNQHMVSKVGLGIYAEAWRKRSRMGSGPLWRLIGAWKDWHDRSRSPPELEVSRPSPMAPVRCSLAVLQRPKVPLSTSPYCLLRIPSHCCPLLPLPPAALPQTPPKMPKYNGITQLHLATPASGMAQRRGKKRPLT